MLVTVEALLFFVDLFCCCFAFLVVYVRPRVDGVDTSYRHPTNFYGKTMMREIYGLCAGHIIVSSVPIFIDCKQSCITHWPILFSASRYTLLAPIPQFIHSLSFHSTANSTPSYTFKYLSTMHHPISTIRAFHYSVPDAPRRIYTCCNYIIPCPEERGTIHHDCNIMLQSAALKDPIT